MAAQSKSAESLGGFRTNSLAALPKMSADSGQRGDTVTVRKACKLTRVHRYLYL